VVPRSDLSQGSTGLDAAENVGKPGGVLASSSTLSSSSTLPSSSATLRQSSGEGRASFAMSSSKSLGAPLMGVDEEAGVNGATRERRSVQFADL
jgi:hypothetical protein